MTAKVTKWVQIFAVIIFAMVSMPMLAFAVADDGSGTSGQPTCSVDNAAAIKALGAEDSQACAQATEKTALSVTAPGLPSSSGFCQKCLDEAMNTKTGHSDISTSTPGGANTPVNGTTGTTTK